MYFVPQKRGKIGPWQRIFRRGMRRGCTLVQRPADAGDGGEIFEGRGADIRSRPLGRLTHPTTKQKRTRKKIAIASFLSKKHSASPSQAAVRGEINPLADILARLPKKMGEFPTKTCGTFPARPLLHILSQSNHKNIRPIMELTCTPDQASLAAPAP